MTIRIKQKDGDRREHGFETIVPTHAMKGRVARSQRVQAPCGEAPKPARSKTGSLYRTIRNIAPSRMLVSTKDASRPLLARGFVRGRSQGHGGLDEGRMRLDAGRARERRRTTVGRHTSS